MWHLGTWFGGGLGGVRFMVGLHYLKGPFQLKCLLDLWFYSIFEIGKFLIELLFFFWGGVSYCLFVAWLICWFSWLFVCFFFIGEPVGKTDSFIMRSLGWCLISRPCQSQGNLSSNTWSMTQGAVGTVVMLWGKGKCIGHAQWMSFTQLWTNKAGRTFD